MEPIRYMQDRPLPEACTHSHGGHSYSYSSGYPYPWPKQTPASAGAARRSEKIAGAVVIGTITALATEAGGSARKTRPGRNRRPAGGRKRIKAVTPKLALKPRAPRHSATSLPQGSVIRSTVG